MKYLPIIAASAILTACASVPPDAVQSVGKSAKAPAELAQCIAQQWANKTQQPITLQTRIANNQGVDVLFPGQPPGGTAAVVRPGMTGPGSWVGLRTAGGSTVPGDATTDISGCL